MTIFSLDLETYTNWEHTPEPVKASLIKRHPHWKKTTAEEDAALSPYSGRIIVATLGIREKVGETAEYHSFYVAPSIHEGAFVESGNHHWTPCEYEKTVLSLLLQTMKHHIEKGYLDTKNMSVVDMAMAIARHKPHTLLTFYGHRFDLPFFVQRARMCDVEPKLLKWFMDVPLVYCDLADELTLHGHLEPRLSLDAYCTLYGIASPKKATTIESGAQVGEAWKNGHYRDVVLYNKADTETLDTVYDLACTEFGLSFTSDDAQSLTHLFRTRVKAKYPG